MPVAITEGNYWVEHPFLAPLWLRPLFPLEILMMLLIGVWNLYR